MEELKIYDSVTVKEIEKHIKVLKTAHDKVKNSAQREIIQKKIDKYTFSRNKLIALFKNDLISKNIDIDKIKKDKNLYELYNKVVADNFKELSLENINKLSKGSRGWEELKKPKDRFQNIVDFVEGKNDWWSIATVGKALVVGAIIAGGFLIEGALIPALIAAAVINPAIFKKEIKGRWNLMKDKHKAKNAMKDADLEIAADQDISSHSTQLKESYEAEEKQQKEAAEAKEKQQKEAKEKQQKEAEKKAKQEKLKTEAETDIQNLYRGTLKDNNNDPLTLDDFKEKYKDLDQDVLKEILEAYGFVENKNEKEEKKVPTYIDTLKDLNNKNKDWTTSTTYQDFQDKYKDIIKTIHSNGKTKFEKRELIEKLYDYVKDDKNFNTEGADKDQKDQVDMIRDICRGVVEICDTCFVAMAKGGTNELDETKMKDTLKEAGLQEFYEQLPGSQPQTKS